MSAEAAVEIRAWEAARPQPALRWPVLIALAFGAVLLGAGVLLFVSAHWDELSPGERMALVVAMVAVFHVAGAWSAGRFPALAMALHTVGTFALGAGIGLTGQIFNLSAHWPRAVLLWALGAGAAWLLLRHWTQGALVAILVPAWIGGELDTPENAPLLAGFCALAVTYLTAFEGDGSGPLRRALGWAGGIALLPAVLSVASGHAFGGDGRHPVLSRENGLAWAVAVAGPLALAYFWRGARAVWNAGAMAWIVVLAALAHVGSSRVGVYGWCAAGAVGLVAWGVKEGRAERINLGVAGFGFTVVAFYFSSVMDKLNRSFSLIVLGLLFLIGGWALERARRRLILQIQVERL